MLMRGMLIGTFCSTCHFDKRNGIALTSVVIVFVILIIVIIIIIIII